MRYTADEIKDWCVYNLEPEMFCTYIGEEACFNVEQMISADRNEYYQKEPKLNIQLLRSILYDE